MNYEDFVKKFKLPDSFTAPIQLVFEDIKAKPLTRSDLKADMGAVNSSLVTIRNTRGGSWPSEPVSEEFDFLDLAWHEREFRDAGSFAYVIYDDKENYIGCFYLYPMGHRTSLSEERLAYDVDASWWVTSETYQKEYYPKVYRALQKWLSEEFPFKKVYYSNKEMP